MNKVWIKTVTVFLVTIMAVSCDAFKTKSKGKKIDQTTTALAGDWQTDCVAADVLEMTRVRRQFVFSAVGDFEKKEYYYKDDACTNLELTYAVSGTYDAVGEGKDYTKLTNINFTISNSRIMVNSDGLIDTLKTLSLCDKSDWVVSKEIDITGVSCAGYTTKKGDVIFDVFTLNDKALRLGQKFIFLSDDDADDRPKNVVSEIVYTRR